DLEGVAALALVRLPRALLEATGHDDAAALGEGVADVLAELAPRLDVEEGGLLLPLLGLAVLPAAVHRDGEGAHALPRGGEAQLRVAGDVPADRDRVDVACHDGLLTGVRRSSLLAEEPAAGRLVVGQADELVADDLVREAQRPLEALEVTAVGGELPDDVVPLGLVVDLVGEAP